MKNSKERENVSENHWHEAWVTKVVGQPTADDYSNHQALRTGKPSEEDLATAKANGPSEKETKAEADGKADDAKNKKDQAAAGATPAPAKALVQLKNDPSTADAEEAAY